MSSKPSPVIRHIPYMGVIKVVADAMKLGFYNGHPDWCNLGQGQPEIGPMEGAPERISTIEMKPTDHAYGHINGADELCEAVAQHYNRQFRQGKSQYTRENVAIAAGGRLTLSRIMAILGSINLGYQIPDYTAYEDMIDAHSHRINPVLLATSESEGFRISPDRFERETRDLDLDAFIFSNPCNPTGQVIAGDDLNRYVGAARTNDCLLIADEFYSHFIYTADGKPGAGPVSASRYIDDIETDPVLVVDGLTKSYRYPGWRVGWAVGPKHMIDTIGRAASAIDGGPPAPIQRAALTVLEPSRADQETEALRQCFVKKRNLMIKRLSALGVTFAHASEGTFYLWGSIKNLPAPFNDTETFYQEALKRKVMTVPGRYFDVNPGQLRKGRSPLADWVRFSFGPPIDNVQLGLDRLEKLVTRQ